LLEYRKIYPKGFYVDVRFKATYDNREEREKLAQYLIRQPIGDNRITKYDPIKKQVKIIDIILVKMVEKIIFKQVHLK